MEDLLKRTLVRKALAYATAAHAGQFRKWYPEVPYIAHPTRVAAEIAARPDATEEMVAAAYLHDVIEDCGVAYIDLLTGFGEGVADLVMELTNPSKGCKGPRAVRKEMDRKHIAAASREAKIIKLYDRLDNLSDLLVIKAPEFAGLYHGESLRLLESIRDADPKVAEKLEAWLELIGKHVEFIKVLNGVDAGGN